MIELLIVFMELVLMAIGALLWSTIKAIALALAALACGLGKVTRPVVDFAVRQVDKFVKDALDVPGLDIAGLDDLGLGSLTLNNSQDRIAQHWAAQY
jgi:hypothetical protein